MNTTYELAVIINTANVIFASELGYYSFVKSHIKFDEASELALQLIDDAEITEEGWKEIEDLHNTKKQIIEWAQGRLKIEGDRVRFDGELLPPSLEEHMLTLFRSGEEYALQSWVNFVNKLVEASHVDTYNRLHNFLRYNDLCITPEGNVLAWKVVTEDFKDKYTRTFDNNVGNVVSMPRFKVNHNPSQTCSAGLHACAFGYLGSFSSRGDQVILVEIDVRDIVSVPTDYDGKKVRCCKYLVKHHVGTWGEDIFADTDPLEILQKVL